MFFKDFEKKGKATLFACSSHKFPLFIADFEQIKSEFQKERKNEEFDRKEFSFAKQMLFSKKKETIRPPSIQKQKLFSIINTKINDITIKNCGDQRKEGKRGSIGLKEWRKRFERRGRREEEGGKTEEEEERRMRIKEEELREKVEDKMEKNWKRKKKCLSMHNFGREKLSELAASILFHKNK